MSQVAPFPPPFKRMLAFNSDIEFTTWQAQVDLFKLFAQRNLETAFSYWMFADPTYTWRLFESDGSWSSQAAAALRLARAGLLDTLHSFGGAAHIGGIAFDRSDIAQAYQRLRDEGIATRIYSNHGTARDVQNIGGLWAPPRVDPIDFRNYWAGDYPGHPAYHLDLTLDYGMRYFWLDIDRARHSAWFNPAADTNSDDLFATQVSRDGSAILRFKRTDLNETPWPTTLATQIDSALSDSTHGFCVVFNHFGFRKDGDQPPTANTPPYFDDAALTALDRLADSQRSGDTLVTTTEKLLNFARLQMTRPWTIEERQGRILVRFHDSVDIGPVHQNLDWQDLMGFAIALEKPQSVKLQLRDERRDAEIWTADGQCYAGIGWRQINTMDVLDDALANA